MSSVEHRAAKVSLITGLSTILGVAFQLISVPVCLRYWGQAAYGGWLALFSAFMLLRSLDTGYVAFVGNSLNYLYHKDTSALRLHLSSALVGVALIGSLQLTLAVSALMLEPLANMLGMTSGGIGLSAERLGLLVLTVSWILTGSYLGIVHRLLIPAGLMFQAAIWGMVFQVSQFLAIMAAAIAGYGLLQTSWLFALSQSTVYFASAIYVARKLPRFSPWWRGATVATGLKDLGQSLMLTASGMIQQSATSGVVLLISAFAGPAGVPVFTTVRTLANLWGNVTNVLTVPLLPEIVRYHANRETRKLVDVNQSFWVLVGSVVNGGVLLCYPLLPWLYARWTAHQVTLDNSLLCLLLAGVVVSNVGALMAMHLNAINSLRIVLAVSVTRAVLALGGGALGYASMGLASFGLGILAGEIVAASMTVRHFMAHELTANDGKLLAATFAPMMLSACSVLLFLVSAGFDWVPGGWGLLLALMGVAAGSAWGWSALDPAVRDRLAGLITRRP